MTRRLLALPPVLAALIAAVAAGGATAGTTPPPRLPVSPARGHVHTTFTVHFTAPDPSGRSGGRMHAYELSAKPGRARRGCIDSVEVQPIASYAGQKMAVRLVARRLGGRWCTGTYSGQVTETVGPACGPPVMAQPEMRTAIVCPDVVEPAYATVVSRIGTFSFRVRRG